MVFISRMNSSIPSGEGAEDANKHLSQVQEKGASRRFTKGRVKGQVEY